MKKKKLVILLILPFLSGCSKGNKGEWVTISSSESFIQTSIGTYTSPFNTIMTLKYFKNEKKEYPADFNKNIKNLFLDNVIKFHEEFDRHYNYLDDDKNVINNVKVINDSYGTNKEVQCSDELYALMKLGYDMSINTNGYFNFYIGNLTGFWDSILEDSIDEGDCSEYDPYFNKTQKALMEAYTKTAPTLDEVKKIMTFNDEKKTVVFNAIDDIEIEGKSYSRNNANSNYRPYITPGGIAKGFATDLLKDILIEKGYTDGYINSGSSSITSLSDLSFTEKGYQTMKVVDPRSGDFIREVAFSIDLYKDYSLSTSGNYTAGKSYSFMDGENVIYRHHIVNPYSGEPSNYHASVTLLSNTLSNGELDALSTAFVNMSLEDGIKFKKDFLDANPGKDLKYIFMDIEGKSLNLYASSELKDDIKILGKDIKLSYE